MDSAQVEELKRQVMEARHARDTLLRNLLRDLSPAQQLAISWRLLSGRSLRAGSRWVRARPVPAALVVLACAGAVYWGATRLRRQFL